MTSRRWVLLLAPVVAFAASWPVVAGPVVGADPLATVTDAVTGWVLVAAGLVTWGRRPTSPTGRWLVAAGYAWYVGDLYFVVPGASIVPLLSFAFRGLYDVLIAAALLSFPGGRLTSRARIAVAAVTALYGARAVAFLAGAIPGRAYPGNGTPNPFDVLHDPTLALNLDIDLSLVKGIAVLVVGVLAVARYRRESTAARRVLGPVVIGGVGWATMTFLVYVEPWLDANLHVRLPWAQAAWWSVPEYLIRGSAAPVGFLIGALLLRAARSAVVDLVADIDRDPLRDQLEPSLRRVLGDPGLRVAFPGADGTGWVDGTGAPVELPGPSTSQAVTPIRTATETLAQIVHDPALLEDPSLVRAIATTVRLAIDNQQLTLALERQLEETRASRRRLVEAGDVERQRIERDLHDGAQQRLVSLAISLQMLGETIGDGATPEVRAELAAAHAELRAAIEELRELAHGLDPAMLRESGLGAAIRSLAERCPTPVTVELALGDGRQPRSLEVAAYFVVAEALANVSKHAAATRVIVRGRADDDHLVVEVEDDGRGGADVSRGSGLRGLADRVAATGGTFELRSRPGEGTRIAADLPLG